MFCSFLKSAPNAMSIPCFLSSAARSFSLSCPAIGVFCCRLRGPCSVTRWVSSGTYLPSSLCPGCSIRRHSWVAQQGTFSWTLSREMLISCPAFKVSFNLKGRFTQIAKIKFSPLHGHTDSRIELINYLSITSTWIFGSIISKKNRSLSVKPLKS